jgi:hypothetical protein
MPYANTEAMQQFLDRFAATIADDEHVVMMLDQAGWHDSRALGVPANVTLVALPKAVQPPHVDRVQACFA